MEQNHDILKNIVAGGIVAISISVLVAICMPIITVMILSVNITQPDPTSSYHDFEI